MKKKNTHDASLRAVIYARYSSESQREESIEGQLRECYAFARKNDISVVGEYIDRAFSAKTDKRPDFQKMIKDSAKRNFDLVIVWKLDRFARNRYDSANYKAVLKRNGVKVMSATESISEGSEGILLESVLEGMAEYYSADLSEKVIRGHTENALKCKYNGGTLPVGYTTDKEQNYHIDPVTASFVLEAFQNYDEGMTMSEIAAILNQHEVKNTRGGRMSIDNVARLLKNRRYTGEYIYRDIVVPDGIPAIVPKELFDRVQEKIAKNKKAPARHKAEDDYILTTKLFCGECKSLMVGESGTSATKQVYHYYKCVSAKKHTGCHMKPIRKAWIEDLVIHHIKEALHDDKLIEDIVQMFLEFQQKENTVLPYLEHELAEAEKAINNMLNAIEQGIITPMTKKRLDALEEKHRDIETEIIKEKMKRPQLSAQQIRFWFERMREYDITVLEQRKRLIDTFVNAIFIYNDRIIFTFNYKSDSKTVLFSELNSSDITSGVRPVRRFITNLRIFFILRAFSGFGVSAPPRKRPLFFCQKSAQNRVRPHV